MNIAQSAVGSAVANCTHFLANYPQLANPCQLAQTRVVAGLSPILQLAKTPPPTT